MTTTPSLFHALLRPSILQILRATGYHSTRPAVLDSLTDLAARYLSLLCERTAGHAAHNCGDGGGGGGGDFSVVDVRLALEDVGALLPRAPAPWPSLVGEDEVEDLRGVDEFVQFFAGQRMKEMMELGSGDGESEATDYLNALKKKHGKTGDDAKYHGTLIGKGIDVGEIAVEGGPDTSIDEWITKRTSSTTRTTMTPPPEPALQQQQAPQQQQQQQQQQQPNGVLSDADSPLSDAPLKSPDHKPEEEEEDLDDRMELV